MVRGCSYSTPPPKPLGCRGGELRASRPTHCRRDFPRAARPRVGRATATRLPPRPRQRPGPALPGSARRGGGRPPVPPLSAPSPPGGSAESGRCSPGSRARRRPAGLLRGTTFPRPPCCSAGPREGPGCQSARVGGGSGTGIPPPAPCPANNKCFRALKAGRQVSCGRVVRG